MGVCAGVARRPPHATSGGEAAGAECLHCVRRSGVGSALGVAGRRSGHHSRPGGWVRWPRHVLREWVRRPRSEVGRWWDRGHPLRLPSSPCWKWLSEEWGSVSSVVSRSSSPLLTSALLCPFWRCCGLKNGAWGQIIFLVEVTMWFCCECRS